MKEKGLWLVLHSFLYTLFFIPVFWFAGINYPWLIIVFESHLLIDTQGKFLLWIVKTILKKSAVEEKMERIITLGLDQVLHLLIPLIIALSAL